MAVCGHPRLFGCEEMGSNNLEAEFKKQTNLPVALNGPTEDQLGPGWRTGLLRNWDGPLLKVATSKASTSRASQMSLKGCKRLLLVQ